MFIEQQNITGVFDDGISRSNKHKQTLRIFGFYHRVHARATRTICVANNKQFGWPKSCTRSIPCWPLNVFIYARCAEVAYIDRRRVGVAGHAATCWINSYRPKFDCMVTYIVSSINFIYPVLIISHISRKLNRKLLVYSSKCIDPSLIYWLRFQVCPAIIIQSVNNV